MPGQGGELSHAHTSLFWKRWRFPNGGLFGARECKDISFYSNSPGMGRGRKGKKALQPWQIDRENHWKNQTSVLGWLFGKKNGGQASLDMKELEGEILKENNSYLRRMGVQNCNSSLQFPFSDFCYWWGEEPKMYASIPNHNDAKLMKVVLWYHRASITLSYLNSNITWDAVCIITSNPLPK